MEVNSVVNLERKTERLMVSLLSDSCLVAIGGVGSAELLLEKSACSDRGVLVPRYLDLVVMEKEKWRYRWIGSWEQSVAMYRQLWCEPGCPIDWCSLQETGMYRCLRMLVALKGRSLDGHRWAWRSTGIEKRVGKEQVWQKTYGIGEQLVVEKNQQ